MPEWPKEPHAKLIQKVLVSFQNYDEIAYCADATEQIQKEAVL